MQCLKCLGWLKKLQKYQAQDLMYRSEIFSWFYCCCCCCCFKPCSQQQQPDLKKAQCLNGAPSQWSWWWLDSVSLKMGIKSRTGEVCEALSAAGMLHGHVGQKLSVCSDGWSQRSLTPCSDHCVVHYGSEKITDNSKALRWSVLANESWRTLRLSVYISKENTWECCFTNINTYDKLQFSNILK